MKVFYKVQVTIAVISFNSLAWHFVIMFVITDIIFEDNLRITVIIIHALIA